jgi:hypothetical protein
MANENKEVPIMRLAFVFTFAAFFLLLDGCGTYRSAESVSPEDLSKESTLVVVRPDRYTLLGTRSVRDYLEITYEEFKPNSAGLPVVKVGVRNKGGKHWWDLKAPDFTIYAQAVFYADSIKGKSVRSAPIFKTNKQPVVLQRAQTADISFTCPLKNAKGYQVIFSEN